MPIKGINARQIFDSRGCPTVEVDLITELGLFRAAVGARIETDRGALEVRDNEPKNYHGLSVLKAIDNIKSIIAPELLAANIEVTDQRRIDELLIELDGTEDKSNLGANAILAVSLAVVKAGAARRGLPLYRHIADLAGNRNIILPVPAFNVISGGLLAGNQLAMAEFMILPTGATSFSEAMKMGSEVYHYLKKAIAKKYGKKSIYVVDEGAFAPMLADAKKALMLINNAIKTAKYDGRVEIAMDVSASDFFDKGKYRMDFKKPKKNPKKALTTDKLKKLYTTYLKKFPIVSMEDPFDKSDWASWAKFTAANNIQVIADSLTYTSVKAIEEAAEKEACNAVLLKPTQVGTVTECVDIYLLAKKTGWGTMVSNQQGETEDTFIADLVVGLSTGQIKTGAPCRSERLAKYNQLLRIEEDLGDMAKYAGKAFKMPK